MTAPVSPIATQGTVEKIDSERRERMMASTDPDVKWLLAALGRSWQRKYEALESLSSAERRIEELGRERDNAKANASRFARDIIRLREAFINILDGLEDEGDRVFFGSSNDADRFREHVRAMDAWNWHFIMEKSVDGPDIYAAAAIQRQRAEAAEALVTTLKAEAEELKRRPDMLKQLLDDANAAHFDATMRADAAEARLASLTGQVEDMRAALVDALFCLDGVADGGFSPQGQTVSGTINTIRAAIRSLPVLPTTGDGGGFVEPRGYSSDPRKLRLLLEGRDNFIVDRGLWSEFVDTLPTGRETSGEVT